MDEAIPRRTRPSPKRGRQRKGDIRPAAGRLLQTDRAGTHGGAQQICQLQVDYKP